MSLFGCSSRDLRPIASAKRLRHSLLVRLHSSGILGWFASLATRNKQEPNSEVLYNSRVKPGQAGKNGMSQFARNVR